MRVEMGELLWRTGMGWKPAFLSEVESCQATISHFLLEPLSSIASVFDCLEFEDRTLLLLGLQ